MGDKVSLRGWGSAPLNTAGLNTEPRLASQRHLEEGGMEILLRQRAGVWPHSNTQCWERENWVISTSPKMRGAEGFSKGQLLPCCHKSARPGTSSLISVQVPPWALGQTPGLRDSPNNQLLTKSWSWEPPCLHGNRTLQLGETSWRPRAPCP